MPDALKPGDHIATQSASGKVRRFVVKDDGLIQPQPNTVGFTAKCDCDACSAGNEGVNA